MNDIVLRTPLEVKERRADLDMLSAVHEDENLRLAAGAARDALKWAVNRQPEEIKSWRDDLEKELPLSMTGQQWLGTRGALDGLRWMLKETE